MGEKGEEEDEEQRLGDYHKLNTKPNTNELN
jgi:hypothetical protein